MSSIFKRLSKKKKKSIKNGGVTEGEDVADANGDAPIDKTTMGDHTNHTQDLYRLPPMEVKAFDDWQEEENGDVKAAVSRDSRSPSPDYDTSSQCDSDDGDDDDDDTMDYGLKRELLEARFKRLSHEEYDNLVLTAESDLADVPEPDYTQDGENHSNRDSLGHEMLGRSPSSPASTKRGEGLIEPKKLRNPCLESREKQELHREMFLNQKMGVDVLHRKSELRKRMDERRSTQKKKEQEELERSRRTSLELRLEEQASKLKFTEEAEELAKNRPDPIPENQSEFLKVHSKISKSKSDS